jgi:hypothetical protein
MNEPADGTVGPVGGSEKVTVVPSEPTLISGPVQEKEPDPWTVSGKSFEQVVQEVYEGKWGVEPELRERLNDAGFDQYAVREAAIRLQIDNP